MQTIAIVGQGDMGSAVAAAFVGQGYRVVTDLGGRSDATRRLAAAAGSEDLGSGEALMLAADLVLSILPPAEAEGYAVRALQAMAAAGRHPLYADCNAIAPATLSRIAARFAAADAPFVDVGIVGPAPRPERRLSTRFYVAGAERQRLLAMTLPTLTFLDMGPQLGRASAMKMAYASMNKGTDALLTAVLMMAESLGVRETLMTELDASQPEAATRMRQRIPYLAATAGRYVDEMREIATSYRDARVTPLFHEGAEWLYATLARTPLAGETRATLPEHRSLDEALEIFCAVSR
jgi:3-hydroxyisobutyrate dehydrogenase-like beta-hydroxyacid dehydrogenase